MRRTRSGFFHHAFAFNGIVMASVVPPLTGTLMAMAQRYFGMTPLNVDRERLVEVATFVRDDPRTRCDLYSVNAGVDTGAEFRSVTFVRGTGTKVSVMLRTSCTELDPHVPTLTAVWEGANWCERETYDMFGIEFDGHPDLRRIFLEESFPGHPLRKSFLPPRSDARGG